MFARHGASPTLVFQDQLDALDDAGRRRRLVAAQGHDFASNDYLALASSAELKIGIVEALSRGVPVGAGASRLLRGNHPEHELLEEEAARFFGSECALFFCSGFAANSALLSTLPQRGDIIIYDERVHASSREGIRLARAGARVARHNEPQAFADELRAWRREGGTGRPWIVVESLYSMDGDIAPLGELQWIADEFEAFLIIDEAHATGVFGRGGRGLAAGRDGLENVITVRTCGKALGCEGALVCCPTIIRDFLINRGRPFIFSTAPSPLMAAGVRAALRILKDGRDRQQQLQDLAAFAADCLEPLGAICHGTQILPLIVGDVSRTMMIALKLQEAGFDVRGIRPPTVPEHSSRLRISITLSVDRQIIAALAAALGEALA
ncbi:MAG TPA: 8-amino-7-oxononanoate synthase [Sphingomicrobium sp.]